VAEPSQKGLVGRADLLASNIYDKKLKFDPDDRPCKGHADIIAWPEEHDDMKSVADDLATESTVKIIGH
jgi:hypothetical protein